MKKLRKLITLILFIIISSNLEASDSIYIKSNKTIDLILINVLDSSNTDINIAKIKKNKSSYILKKDTINKVRFLFRYKGKYYEAISLDSSQLGGLYEVKAIIRNNKILIYFYLDGLTLRCNYLRDQYLGSNSG